MSISIIYAATAFLSLLLLAAYFVLPKKKEIWFWVLFTAVFVVNTGYFILSVSNTLDGALWANRLSYAGSVFLPLSMLMIILQTLGVKYSQWLPKALLLISFLVFLVAASPGYLDIYYADVTIMELNGATALVKEYGPYHMLYYVYLAVYFTAMIACILWNAKKRNFGTNLHCTILAAAVFVNIGVWLMGQLVDVNFEFLSISYVMTSLFILFLKLLQEEMVKIQDDKIKFQILASAKPGQENIFPLDCEKIQVFEDGLPTLTATEQKVYTLLLQEKNTAEILDTLHIKENTLKYHNKNIYSKLGVTSRKELVAVAKAVKSKK